MLPVGQLSPYLESCCVRASATVSYENAALDVEYYTGIHVPAKTQQRLVHRQEFMLPSVTAEVEELSVDGGKVRLRTPEGQECIAARLQGGAPASASHSRLVSR